MIIHVSKKIQEQNTAIPDGKNKTQEYHNKVFIWSESNLKKKKTLAFFFTATTYIQQKHTAPVGPGSDLALDSSDSWNDDPHLCHVY